MSLDIPNSFIAHAAKVLTDNGLTGPRLVEITVSYASDFSVELPHVSYPFKSQNKRTALLENLSRFDSKQQHQMLKEMCDRLDPNDINSSIRKLKSELMEKYGRFASDDHTSQINRSTVIEVRHWLDMYPDSKRLYENSLQKHDLGLFKRNALDDLRLSLELLLRKVFSNSKSLENQIADVGIFIRTKGGSSEFGNMFQKLIEYYTKYQNTYVKHDDAVVMSEFEFIFDLTSIFMKHFIKLSK